MLAEEEQRVGAAHGGQCRDDALDQRLASGAGNQVHDHLGVDGGLEDRAARLELLAQIEGVDQVAVVRDGEAAVGELDHERLRVLQQRAAAGRVAIVADGGRAGEAAEDLVVEDVGDQSEAAVRQQQVAVGGDDARALLAAVLQGVQAEVGEIGGLGVPVHPHEGALLAEAIVARGTCAAVYHAVRHPFMRRGSASAQARRSSAAFTSISPPMRRRLPRTSPSTRTRHLGGARQVAHAPEVFAAH